MQQLLCWFGFHKWVLEPEEYWPNILSVYGTHWIPKSYCIYCGRISRKEEE